MTVRKVHYVAKAWLSARYGYTTACTRNPDGVETTNDVTQTTCGSCMKRPEYRRDMVTATRAVAETPVCTIWNECAVCLGGGICPDRCATCGGTNSRECRTHDSILLVDVETAPAPAVTHGCSMAGCRTGAPAVTLLKVATGPSRKYTNDVYYCGSCWEWHRTGTELGDVQDVIILDASGQTQGAAPAVITPMPADPMGDAITNLFERARSLGYTDASAMDVADVFYQWNYVSDPCPVHPAMSTTCYQGYAVDGCESCKVIELTDAAGWTMDGWVREQNERHVAYIVTMQKYLAEGQAAGDCVCWIITEAGREILPEGGIACNGCGSVFTLEGTDASPEVAYASAVAVMRRAETGPDTSPEFLETARRALINTAAVIHWANANSDDPERAYGDSPVYRESGRALETAFLAAYPGHSLEALTQVLCDNMPTPDICADLDRVKREWPGFLETGDRYASDPIQDDAGDLPVLPDAPCTRARLEHLATMNSDATYAAAHDATLVAMCRAYIRTHKAIHRTAQATGYTVALIDYVRITFPDLTQDRAEMVVCEALADACADLAD